MTFAQEMQQAADQDKLREQLAALAQGRSQDESVLTGAEVSALLQSDDPAVLAALKTLLGEIAPGERLPAPVNWAELAPQPRPWLVTDWIPAGRVGLLVGRGSVGKSFLALQLALNVIGESGHWIGKKGGLPELAVGQDARGPVEYLSYEDEENEAGNRFEQLLPQGKGLHCLGDIRYRYMGGKGPLWGRETPFTPAGMTILGNEALAAADDAALLIIDPLAAAYGDNENDRPAVRVFMSALDAWAADTGCAVLILAHPNKESLKADKRDTPPVFSGSTDWEGAARFVLTLWHWKNDGEEGHTLRVTKSNYARTPWPELSLTRPGTAWIADNQTPAGKTKGEKIDTSDL